MKKMYRVKIVSSSRYTYWYADKIGEEYIVTEFNKGNWVCIKNCSNLIDKKDSYLICEVVEKLVYEDVKPKVKKYKVLYKSIMNNDYCVSVDYYKDVTDFYNKALTKEYAPFVQLIADSMIEVEV